MAETRDLVALYRQTVLDHSRQPRNFRRLDPADRTIVGHNPLCGDKMTLYLNIDQDRIEDLSFEGTGCAISMASASIMTEMLRHRSLDEAQLQIDSVMRDFEPHGTDDIPIDGAMAALGGVRAYPSRIKCATLAWKTLAAALRNQAATVTTED